MKKILLPLFLLLANIVFGQVDLNLGLRAYYPFSGNANDVSGNNNNPSFNNATLSADRFGNPNSAYHFNGTNNYMQIPNSASLNMPNQMSVALWVKATGYYTGPCYNNMLVTKSATTTLPSNFYVRFADVYNGCTAPTTTDERFSGNNTVAPTPLVQLNEWYSVVWTSDGVLERIYVNCVLKVTAFASGVPFSNALDMFFGKQNSGAFPYWLNGDLDEIRIYDRALNQDEVNTLGGCTLTTSCNNWLSTPATGSYLTAGDIDVTGNQITVEATYNRTQPLNGGLYPGHLVSKHTNVSNDNYSLFPNGCAITTTNGYKETFETCGLGLNKTYHVAMVYDGSFLKFYRNGFLMTQVACTGNMVTNDLLTTIAQYAGTKTATEQFLGNVNEVRIWNVARTQAQLQTYMNIPLPNPTTQTGLQAYYTFNNLVNQTGNNAFNAIINGAATINNINPNCTFVADSCVVPVTCSNWLSTPTHPSTATIGNLNVTGNQITVEANFNCTAYNFPDVGGKIVSKHTNAANTCYALSPHAAELFTSNNGYVVTYQSCPFQLNKTYHTAMVYDGASLKFYRNGFLMSQVPCSGNISSNSLLATIGNGPTNPLIAQFFGQINEVRIWNVARTQAQLQTYMNSSLPNPTTQPGLLAYYTFDNLLNKQGNATWNATLNGGAAINATNPNCTFTADSCGVITANSVIINAYTPVLALNPCNNILTVEDGTAYNVGDTVLLIQMKGAIIDSTNTAAFGTITDYKNSGNYEFNYVKSKSGNNIELTNALTRQYDIPVGKVQLIRVPYYINLTTTDTLTCLPWDGNKGGVLVFNVQNTLTLNADLNVSGKGFKGGIGYNPGNATLTCFRNNYFYPANTIDATYKGESITSVSNNIICGKGNLAGGGGGGAGHNSGGGGGSNAGIGGFGGYQLDNCGSAPFDNRGIGGRQLAYSTAGNRIFMGSGGGAGHADNPGNVPPAGGNGAGIIIVNADKIQSNAKKIIANGDNGLACSTATSPDCHDAMGGGGAGGTILLSVNQYLDNSVVENKGGKGADVVSGNIAAAGRIGPGGGGGGGLAFLKSATIPANLAITNIGGLNGVLTQDANNPWGAMPGTAGQNLFNLVLPVDNIPFKANIDSVRIKDSITSCLNVDFKGFAYTNTNPISNWQWYFGDAGTANTQNTSHTYAAAGTFIVKLVVTDINGCKDSVLKPVTVNICNSIVINDYTSVLGFNPCDNKLTVENGTAYNIGDTVLLIQMKGAVIDSTNTAAFGTITDYKNSGNYEFNYVKSRSGNTIELTNTLTRQYDIPVGKVQLIRVPYYTNLTTSDILTCLPWDGNKGGVLVFNVQNALTLNNDMDVSGKGFNGGIDPATVPPAFNCNENEFYYPVNPDLASGKGEGIANISAAKSFGKGALANGGGGGNSHNSGGAGGGNISAGGFGGYQFEGTPCNGTVPFDNRGISGKALTYSNASNKIFLGGGGGAGHTNNPELFQATGGNGAGIIIVSAGSLTANSKKIIANGNDGTACGNTGSDCHEGMGGGGAAGTVLLKVNNYLDNVTIQTKGGKGADMTSAGNLKVGTGGGGSGGPLWLSNASLPANVAVINSGGINGVCSDYGNDAWGATPGAAGQNLFNLILPIDIVPFKTNIDSVRIKDSILSCNDFDFKGLAYINTAPIASWQWYFGDGGQANTQNTSHAYGAAGLYTVKLIVTDVNGCMDSVLKDVNALPAVTANAGTDVSICSNTTVSVTLNGMAVGGPYLWSPAIYLNNPTIQNPVATISSTTTFYLTVVGSATCTAIDSVTITINPVPLVDTRTDTTICRFSPLLLTTNSNATTFQWSPAGNVSNPTIASPNYTGNASGWVYVTGSFASGCSATDSLYITVNPIPFVDTRPDTAICRSSPLILNTNSDATTYQWSPAASVSNPTIASPNYINNSSGWVYVTGYFASGCSATDSLYVTVNPVPLVDTRTDTTICRLSPLILSTSSNATIFQWSPASNVNNSTIANPNYTGNASGWMYVTGFTAAGCFAKDSLYVTVNPLPVVQTIADSTLCQNQNITLTTTGAQTYSWTPAIGLSNPNIASPVFIGNNTQTYTVTGTDANGCKNTDLVIINVILPGTFKAPPAFTICQKKSVQLDGNNGNQVSYLWSPATYLSSATIINPMANPPQTTLYTLLVTDNRCGYDSTFTTLLTVVPSPVINARKSNDIDCAFKSATIFASGGNQYVWSPSTGLSNPNISSPVATPANTQTYTVLVTNATGCTNTDSVTIFIKRAASLARYMPNAFTPDGNGINDCYGLKNWMYIQKLQFYIFNRYGEQVFATSNPNVCWNGTYKGKPALAGTYVYVIKAQTDCGEEEQKGSFILIR